jgi:hypothetical protein
MTYRMPCDWDLAVKYRLANRVMRIKQITVDYDDASTFCPCCMKPIPTAEQLFELNCNNFEFQHMGSPGYPITFEFFRFMMFNAAILAVVWFVPTWVKW